MKLGHAYICEAVRTPIGRYGGTLTRVRPDDLAAVAIAGLLARCPGLDPVRVEDVILGCANQAGEDNRNVARMALLLAGLPAGVPGVTVNRLCASGLEAVASAARAVTVGAADVLIAGGVESMSRAPFVMPKPAEAFSRRPEVFDTTIGWRFVNPRLAQLWGAEPMPDTAERLATMDGIARADQDAFALRSQQRAAAAREDGRLAAEIVPVPTGRDTVAERDEHPRETTIEKLAALKPIVHVGGTVTAGNASGVNDGAAALLIASDRGVRDHGLSPRAVILGSCVAGVEPGVMGIGPVPATQRLLGRLGMTLDDMDLIELNEAFAAQAIACMRRLGIQEGDERVNPLGGAIALGHPLGMSGARLACTTTHQLSRMTTGRALCTMCVGVGQGMAMVIERC